MVKVVKVKCLQIVQASEHSSIGKKNFRMWVLLVFESFEWIMVVCFCWYRKTLFSWVSVVVVNRCVDYRLALGFGKTFELLSGVCKNFDLLLGHCTLYFSTVYVVFLNFDVFG